MLQAYLPLNPEQLPGVPLALAFNIASSFVTNTNWQAYNPEISLSQFSQMAGLAVQNFLSAASAPLCGAGFNARVCFKKQQKNRQFLG